MTLSRRVAKTDHLVPVATTVGAGHTQRMNQWGDLPGVIRWVLVIGLGIVALYVLDAIQG
jgi:hypothetical protein